MLSQEVGRRLGVSHRHVDTVLVEAFSTIARNLYEHEPVTLQDFGKFEIRFRKGWFGKHPVTSRKTSIEGRHFIAFSPGKKLKEKVTGNAKRKR